MGRFGYNYCMIKEIPHTGSRPRRAGRRAFTLIELMVVVAVIALLAAMLVPSVSSALEQSRITSCSNVLHHIAIAMEDYTSDNNNHFPFWFDFRLLIGPYLGMDKSVIGYYYPWAPQNNTRCPYLMNTTWDQVKQFQCPSGVGLGTNASASGNEAVQTYWQINSYWLGIGPINDYFPNLQLQYDLNNYYYCAGGPSRNGLLCEVWQVDTINGPNPDINNLTSPTYQIQASYLAQPYSTHYKFGNVGVMGVGRNILYADWHIDFRKCTFSGPWDGTSDAGYWSDPSSSAVWIPSTKLDRGNEVGWSFILGGKTFWGWQPIIFHTDGYHYDVSDWWWP